MRPPRCFVLSQLLVLLLQLSAMHRTLARLHRPFGLALDIDGVLLRGSTPIPRAAEALAMLAEARVPHIFMTNGGGVLESVKAQELSDKLGCEVTEDQILLSHTPMRQLAQEYRDKWVLVLGHKDVVNVARTYGFNKVTTVDEVFARFPSMIPFFKPKPDVVPWKGDVIDAAMVFYDPIDWYVEMQILCDVLQGGHPNAPNHARQIPLYASNPDFIFSSTHPKPRFAQGAFTQAVGHLYKKYTQQELQVQYFGKPTKVQYAYAETLIKTQCRKLGIPEPTAFYGIGDNPHADVRGANNAGDHWHSIMVCTGVFQGTPDDNDLVDKADRVEFDVYEAVKRLLSK